MWDFFSRMVNEWRCPPWECYNFSGLRARLVRGDYYRMENVGNKNREKMRVKGVWLRWGKGRRKWWAWVFFLIIWGDSGVFPIQGKRWAIKGGLMENYPSTPIFSHMLVSLSLFSIFSAITFRFFLILIAIFLTINFF